MAKIYGINGVITGKLGAAVYAVRNGEQISRQYQPIVSNPSTEAQVKARAKLKLMSQLSAVMASVIAIPRMGAVSSRNLFVKLNYANVSFATNAATINLMGVKLTKSVVSMPAISLDRSPEAIRAFIASAGRVGNLDVDRVVYCMFEKLTDETLRYVGSAVASSAGELNNWGVVMPAPSNEVIVYAYGVRLNSEAARAIFGDMTIPSATLIANLVVTRSLTESDVTLTETVAANIAAAQA